MKKITLLLIVFCAILSSCSGDDSSQDASTMLVKRIETSNHGSLYTTFFQYNGNKIVSQKSEKRRLEFFYSGDNIVKIDTYYGVDASGNGGELNHYVTFEYNEQGFLKSYSQIENDFIVKGEYVYNADNTINYIDSNNALNGGGIGELNPISAGIIIGSGTDITGMIDIYTGEEHTLTFDGKNHPLKNVLGHNKLFLYNYTFPSYHFSGYATNPGGANNFIYKTGSGADYFTINYNSSNFPTKITFGYDGFSINTLYY